MFFRKPRTIALMNAQALRERTRTEHEATEALLPLMDEHLTRLTYVAALQALLPLLQSWESWSRRHCPEAQRPLLEGRQRSLLLLRDLEALGAVPVGEVLPAPFDSLLGSVAGGDLAVRHARFLGALYVVEGSTLGGQFIARHVETALGLSPGEGNAYFLGYGEQTSARWREVKAALAEAPDGWLEESVEAARRVFGMFGEAFRATSLAAVLT